MTKKTKNYEKQCEWHKKKWCHVKPNKCLYEGCDLYQLQYNLPAIKKKIRGEIQWLIDNKKEQQKAKIDHVMGLKVLYRATCEINQKPDPFNNKRKLTIHQTLKTVMKAIKKELKK